MKKIEWKRKGHSTERPSGWFTIYKGRFYDINKTAEDHFEVAGIKGQGWDRRFVGLGEATSFEEAVKLVEQSAEDETGR